MTPFKAGIISVLRRVIYQFTILLMWCVCATALAGVNIDLFEETLSAKDKSPSTRQAVMRDALAHVLIRASGNRQVATIAAIGQAIKKPEPYLQAYEYSVAGKEDSLPAKQDLQLRFVFDAVKVERLLKQAHQNLWPAFRPSVLVWWAEGLDANVLVSEMHGHDTRAAMVKTWGERAKLRGIVTSLPIRDLSLLNQLDVSDIWQARADKLIPLGTPYHTDMQAVVTQRPQDDGSTVATLTLLNAEGEGERWTEKGKDKNQLAIKLMDSLADALRQRDGVSLSTTLRSDIQLVVNHINDAASVVRLREYLSTLPGVRRVQPVKIERDTILFALDYQGQAVTFSNKVALGKVLRPSDRPLELAADVLHYQLIS